jgi:hypothetical protein
MAAAFGALALAACHGTAPTRSHGGPAARQTVQQLGFAPLATAEQLGPGWQTVRARHLLRTVVLAPDASAALLVFAAPVDWTIPAGGPPVPANAVWLELGGQAPRATACVLPGALWAVDFKARMVECLGGVPAGEVPTQIHAGGAQSVSMESAGGGYVWYDVAAGHTVPVNPTAEQDGLRMGPFWVDDLIWFDDPSLAVDAKWKGAQWSYTLPASGSAGTGRTAAETRPGQLKLAVGFKDQGTVSTGSLPFHALTGDAGHTRAFLALEDAGVVLADLRPEADPPLRWLIRDSGSTQFLLRPESDRLVVATADGLSMIGLAELAELAPRLSAAQALSSKQTRRLKPAVKALGWDWTAVQFNPLGSTPGRLGLLDSADPDSATAELEWSADAQHALRLFITRQPRPEDEALRTADPAARNQQVLDILSKLGWPAAVAEDNPAASAEGEVQQSWRLDPAATAPRDPGRFSLWLTPDAAVWELRGATAALPANVIATEAAQQLAIAQAQQAAGFSANPQALPGGGTAGLFAGPPRLGWAGPGPAPFGPLASEPYTGAVAFYEFDVLQTSLRPQAYTVRVPVDGQAATASLPQPAPLSVLRRARQGEFGADAVRALADQTAAESLRLTPPPAAPPAS